VHHRFDPRRQLIYRFTHGLTEVLQFLSIHSPVKRSTDIGAAQPEFNILMFVHHRILDTREPEARRHRIGRDIP